MKLKLSIFSLMICLFYQVNAQDLSIKEQKMQFGEETYNALVVGVENPDEAQESVEGYAKSKLDTKLKKESKEVIMAEKITLSQVIATKRGDFLVLFNDQNQMAFAFRMGYDFILNSEEYPQEMFRFKQLVNDILLNYHNDKFLAQIEAKEDQIKDLNKQKDRNTNEGEKLGKEIARNKKKIGKETDEAKKMEMENENIELSKEQEALTEKNANLQSKIEELKGEVRNIRDQMNELARRASKNVQNPNLGD